MLTIYKSITLYLRIFIEILQKRLQTNWENLNIRHMTGATQKKLFYTCIFFIYTNYM